MEKRTRTYPYDLAHDLRTEEDREAYLEAAREDGDAWVVANAHEVVARSRTMVYRYEIAARPQELGGGWRLRLLERGEEVGGGVFPPENATEEALKDAYGDAVDEGETWRATRPPEDGSLEV